MQIPPVLDHYHSQHSHQHQPHSHHHHSHPHHHQQQSDSINNHPPSAALWAAHSRADLDPSVDYPVSASYPDQDGGGGGGDIAALASLPRSRAGSSGSSLYNTTSPNGDATAPVSNYNSSSPSRPMTGGSTSANHSSEIISSGAYSISHHHPPQHHQDLSLFRFALSNPQPAAAHHSDHQLPASAAAPYGLALDQPPVPYDGYRTSPVMPSGAPSRPLSAYSGYAHPAYASPKLARSPSEGRPNSSYHTSYPSAYVSSQLAQFEASRSLLKPPGDVHPPAAGLHSHDTSIHSSHHGSPALSGSPGGSSATSSWVAGLNQAHHRQSSEDTTIERINHTGGRYPASVAHKVTTILCLHASVAQKSYGQERRFLCPPPMVRLSGPYRHLPAAQRPVLAVAILDEEGTSQVAQACCPDDNPFTSSTFKNLYISGQGRKGKSITIQLGLHPPSQHPQLGFTTSSSVLPDIEHLPAPFATFQSRPCTILSKPSKRTAKARSIQSCILNGSLICLFNRINSQTVRTKYLCVDNGDLAARASIWSAFHIRVVRKAEHRESSLLSSTIPGADRTITYGSEVVLVDYVTQTSSEPLIVRKVEKDRAQTDATGPVSQMQKLAFCKLDGDGESPMYISALSGASVDGLIGFRVDDMSYGTSGIWAETGGRIQYQSIRGTAPAEDSGRAPLEIIDNLSAWTVMGVDQFEYSFLDSSPHGCQIPRSSLTPFPTVSGMPTIELASATLSLKITRFFDHDPRTGTAMPLEVWLGPIGPLPTTIVQASGVTVGVGGSDHHLHLQSTGMSSQVQESAPSSSAHHSSSRRESTIRCALPSLAKIAKTIYADWLGPGALATLDDGPNCDFMSPSAQMCVEQVLVKAGIADFFDAHVPSSSSGLLISYGTTTPGQSIGAGDGSGGTGSSTSKMSENLPITFVRPDGISFASARGVALEKTFTSAETAKWGMGPANSLVGSGTLYLPRIV